MSMVDIIEDRLVTTMMRALELGVDPEPMLAFCRGEADLGVVSGPEMPEDMIQRFDIYRAWASFMGFYGATEAVFCRYVVVSVVDPDTDILTFDPNDDPAARTALQVVRFPSGQTANIWYHLGDHGEVEWEYKQDVDECDDLGVMFLKSAMGWAPLDQSVRINAPQWLREKAPGATVGLMPPALE
jgi:hypothetical protein